MTLEVDKKTTVRQYLTRIRKNVQKSAELRFQYETHPDRPPALGDEHAEAFHKARESWNWIAEELFHVLGVQIIPWHQLLSGQDLLAPRYSKVMRSQDPLRISMWKLAQRAKKRKEEDGHDSCEAG